MRHQPWNIKRAEKGMIMDVYYTNKKGEQVRHYILVLNPKYRYPGEKEWKLHAIKLNDFPEKALNKLAETYGITWVSSILKYRKMSVVKLVQEISSRRFYNQEIWKLMKKHPAYRTYILDNFTKASVVDYKFDDVIEERYLTNNKLIIEADPDADKRHNIGKQ